MAITKIKCNGHEEWLEERKKSIGGSDAGIILGFSKYRSPYSLWAEKTGHYEPEDISDKEAVRLGNDLEDYVAKRFEEATEKKVRRCNYLLRNDLYPFAHACPDRLVVGEDAGLEIKTTSSFDYVKRCQNGDFPEVYYSQCVHYLAVTGAKKWYLAVLCLGHGFYTFEIDRNEAEIDALMTAEKAFWDLVVSDTPPAVDGSQSTTEALTKVFPESDGSEIDLTYVESHILQYKALGDQIKALTSLQDAEKAAIEQYMGTAEKGRCGEYSISWKSSERSTFDRKAYEQNYGALPAGCMKTSTVRTFRFTENKK